MPWPGTFALSRVRAFLRRIPGEMSRLTGQTMAEIQRTASAARALRHRARRVSGVERKSQRDRVSGWPRLDQSHRLALHGHWRHRRRPYRTDRWIGGAVPGATRNALLAAVWLHGRAGELGAETIGEKSFIATDLFEFLPEAMREIADLFTPNLKKRPSRWARIWRPSCRRRLWCC